ncbi:MAG: competence/damage-inducible protein A [Alistipes sp.]|nr:competence/damage-inducible protein A [Alistipes sp.]
MKAEIITVGDEILIGQIVDTNAAYIARRLNETGIVVNERTSVGDDAGQITECIGRAFGSSDIVIMTGGLGPTKDDITKKTLAEMFGSRLVNDARVEEHVRNMLALRGIPFNELNRGQSLVPECCTVLFNVHGTAPGMWFERDGRVLVSLPGVPFEMKHLMDDEVLPRLKKRFELRSVVHRTMITEGIAESMLAECIAAWESALPPYLKLAYLPAPNIVRLRLSAYEVEGDAVRGEIEMRFRELYDIIPDNIIGYETATLQETVHRLLTDRGLTLAVAESCTGGSIASKFTAMAGASAYFKLGAVTYSNEAKISVLGVSPDTLAHYGAVSEQTAREMAEGARRIAGTDYAVATTGIAGPSGGTAEKPVGTVWFAVASEEGTVAVMRNSGTDRGQIIERATAYAIELLRDRITGRR